jgi:putative membrane-bound dehydrogenase-like protein
MPVARARHRLPSTLLAAIAAVLASAAVPAGAEPPRFESPIVTPRTPGHAVSIDLDIAGAKELWLLVADAGDGYGCDWADWAEPLLVGPAGEKRLTDLTWKHASAEWGETRAGRNAAGGPLRIAGKAVAWGIGTHARSLIGYDLPPGYERFRARGGLDNGGTDQEGCGDGASVRFVASTERPARREDGRPAGGGDSVHDPANAVANLDVAPGLEATLFASEPTILSPTNLDVDYLGRVWVCEVVNYRGHNGKRPEGDRILILEDSDGDGRADHHKVFYQGRDIDSAMGIAVLGNAVVVSASPNIFVFHDDNGDDVPDRKELLFTKTGQPQHDHSAHSFIFGPDGKLYWNFGNSGQHVHDRDGKPVVDLAGNRVVDNGKPYFGGMVFRCEMDGSRFEVLGHNFRNNYEVAVDAFGNLWQSDNDDDGNRGARINFVMEFGNYGYRDEKTGAGWSQPRTGLEEEVPLRHWHLNDPGVVPNLLQTGAGSPCGIAVYEGDLLPAVFRDQVIHCEPGHSVVRAYPAAADGAGYRAEIANILQGARNNWFRPADVCVAPDGSLFVTDWYDPGVGGHAMGDLGRGRIFRVAPPGRRYRAPRFDFASTAGAIEAFKSPNLAVRYLAWTALQRQGEAAAPALEGLFRSSGDARLRARALWLLAKLPGGAARLAAGQRDADPDIRIVALRAARQLGVDLAPMLEALVRDPSPAVRRECAVALRHLQSPAAPALWAELARQHDGRDRWYLEALGIGAEPRWDACLSAWLERVGDSWSSTRAGRDVVWRSRAARTPELLAQLIRSPELDAAELTRCFRAFDFNDGEARNAALASLAFEEPAAPSPRQDLIAREALGRLSGFDVSTRPEYASALERVLKRVEGTAAFVEFVERFSVASRFPDLLRLAVERPDEQLGADAARVLVAKGGLEPVEAALAGEPKAAASLARALGGVADRRAQRLLRSAVVDPARDASVRREAARGLARSRAGAETLIELARADALDEACRAAAAFNLHRGRWRGLGDAIERHFPLPGGKDEKPLPPVEELLKLRGDAARGREIYRRPDVCIHCHVVAGEGKTVGPDLSEIGAKLSREAMLESILFPSAGISHSYETELLVLKDGNTLTGIIVSETPEAVTIRGVDALDRAIKKAEILSRARQETSLMPADLQKLLTAEDLADLLSYLATLKGAGG